MCGLARPSRPAQLTGQRQPSPSSRQRDMARGRRTPRACAPRQLPACPPLPRRLGRLDDATTPPGLTPSLLRLSPSLSRSLPRRPNAPVAAVRCPALPAIPSHLRRVPELRLLALNPSAEPRKPERPGAPPSPSSSTPAAGDRLRGPTVSSASRALRRRRRVHRELLPHSPLSVSPFPHCSPDPHHGRSTSPPTKIGRAHV